MCCGFCTFDVPPHPAPHNINVVVTPGLPYAANLPPDARKEALRKRAGKLEVVKLLLARGANPSADSFGKTALFEAARDGFEEAMRALIAAGASPSRADTKDRGDSPLLVAADDDHLATVQLLMVCGNST